MFALHVHLNRMAGTGQTRVAFPGESSFCFVSRLLDLVRVVVGWPERDTYSHFPVSRLCAEQGKATHTDGRSYLWVDNHVCADPYSSDGVVTHTLHI